MLGDCRRPEGEFMLRAEATAERFHARQAESLPGRFGLVVTRIAEGELDAELALQPWMMAPNGYLHAASVLLLADTAAGYACAAHLPDKAKNFTTIELKSNFLGSAREGTIRAECRADHLGRTTHVWSATVFGPDGKRIALFRCTQMILW
jgi:1,4-dihydroxy-2-naphthoyl-CoA hydrolase